MKFSRSAEGKTKKEGIGNKKIRIKKKINPLEGKLTNRTGSC
jgi:hypothetical protein